MDDMGRIPELDELLMQDDSFSTISNHDSLKINNNINNVQENELIIQKEEPKIEDLINKYYANIQIGTMPKHVINDENSKDNLASEIYFSPLTNTIDNEEDVYLVNENKIWDVRVLKIKKRSKYRNVFLAAFLFLITFIILIFYVWYNFNSPSAKAERKLLNDYCIFYQKKDIGYISNYLDDKNLIKHQKALDIIKKNDYNIQCSYNYNDNKLGKKALKIISSCLNEDLDDIYIAKMSFLIRSLPQGDKSKAETKIVYGVKDGIYKIYEVTSVIASGFLTNENYCSYRLDLDLKGGN